MSMTEPVARAAAVSAGAEPWERAAAPAGVAEQAPLVATPIVPKTSIAGRALIAVIAIMTFLASLTTGAVMLVRAAANDWQSQVAREVTIQVRPGPGRDLDALVDKAAAIARAAPGIAAVRPYTKEESARLIEPWLGTGLALDDLPIPRLIVVKVEPGGAPDFASLRRTLEAQVAGASLDDHRGWVDRMSTMARTAVAVGLGVLVLVLVVTVLSITFATRGAMATNRPIVEVLHYVGATDSFVANEFQRHFLILGLKGGAIGGGAALVLFATAQLAGTWLTTTGENDGAMLFGSFSIGPAGYIAILLQVIMMAVVTAWTSRHTVNRTLQSIE